MTHGTGDTSRDSSDAGGVDSFLVRVLEEADVRLASGFVSTSSESTEGSFLKTSLTAAEDLLRINQNIGKKKRAGLERTEKSEA